MAEGWWGFPDIGNKTCKSPVTNKDMAYSWGLGDHKEGDRKLQKTLELHAVATHSAVDHTLWI
jgi:hypothetical protein